MLCTLDASEMPMKQAKDGVERDIHMVIEKKIIQVEGGT